MHAQMAVGIGHVRRRETITRHERTSRARGTDRSIWKCECTLRQPTAAAASTSTTEPAAAAERPGSGDGPAERAEPGDAPTQRSVDASEHAAAAAGPPNEGVGGVGLIHGASPFVGEAVVLPGGRDGEGGGVAVVAGRVPGGRSRHGEAQHQGGDAPPLVGRHFVARVSMVSGVWGEGREGFFKGSSGGQGQVIDGQT
jgi:hypothetical protein